MREDTEKKNRGGRRASVRGEGRGVDKNARGQGQGGGRENPWERWRGHQWGWTESGEWRSRVWGGGMGGVSREGVLQLRLCKPRVFPGVQIRPPMTSS